MTPPIQTGSFKILNRIIREVIFVPATLLENYSVRPRLKADNCISGSIALLNNLGGMPTFRAKAIVLPTTAHKFSKKIRPDRIQGVKDWASSSVG